MRVAALLGLALAAAVVSAETKYKEEKNVLTLDDSTFDAALEEFSDGLLVAFVAPWCGHCKKLKPEFAKAAKVLKAEGKRIAQVDATVSKDLASRFEVQGFPTLKFFRNGTPSEYNGGREQDAIVNWVRKKTGPLMVKISTTAEAEAFEAKSDAVLVCFAEEGSAAYKACETAAGKVDDVPFAISNAAELRTKYNLPASGPAVVTINTFEGQDNVVAFPTEAEAWTADSNLLSKWATAAALPLVVTFSQEAAPKIFRGDLKVHFLLFADTDSDAGAAALKEFRSAAASTTGIALFVNVPPSEDRVMSYFGVTAKDIPTAVLVNMADGGMKKFKFSGDLNAAGYSAFLKDYAAGKLKPFLKSDPAPDAAENAAADVKIVTGSNFEELALNADHDVLLEVYAPWCGHCKSLAPIYEKLGKAIKAAGLKTVTVAKMDGTTNEIDYPGVNVKGFPTIVFFPAGAKKAVEYEGGRDLAGFAAFLAKNAKSASVDAAALEDAAEAVSDDDEEEDKDEL